LLSLMGAGALAADPGLGLRLLPAACRLPPLSVPSRRLLAQRLPSPRPGRAQAALGGGAGTGLAKSGRLSTMLPSQRTLPRAGLAGGVAPGGPGHQNAAGRAALPGPGGRGAAQAQASPAPPRCVAAGVRAA